MSGQRYVDFGQSYFGRPNDISLGKKFVFFFKKLGYFLTYSLFSVYCIKSAQSRSFFWSVFSCIHSEYRKIRTRKSSVFGQFSRSGD